MAFKRTRDGEAEDITVMANCLMLLSGSGTTAYGGGASSRVFKCKTCDREFPSFQALGGHRASHKKPRLMGGAGDHFLQPPSPPKPKTHECSICGLEFPIGQALGGHMRRHRSAMVDDQVPPPPSFLSLSPPHVQVVKKANSSSRRVLSLDLNLTPSENKFVFGKIDVPMFLIASSESH